ncbi:hypothetical protein ACEN88_34235, partial [Massilia sp. CT11-108]|uniref:hypothetical protein n=1 Tax=Massilia sp. CT11-108 TaxID=3393900 RepID=UPI0039A6E2F7
CNAAGPPPAPGRPPRGGGGGGGGGPRRGGGGGADAAPPDGDDALVDGGHAMLVADGALTLDVAARLVSLTLQSEVDGRPAEAAQTGASTPFLADAAQIFPEFTWLFG